MAVCSWCDQEMTAEATVSCTGNATVCFPDGQKAPAIPFTPMQEGKRCHDCNVAPNGFHHPGCDTEDCPLCGCQIITCGCGCEDD